MIVCAAAVLLRERRLLLGADGADQVDAERLRPLAGDEADAAGGGVPQDVSPAFGMHVQAAQQVLTVRPCSIMLAACSKLMPSGSFTRRSAGMDLQLGVRAERAVAVGDAVAHLEIGDARADRFHHARGLEADARRQRHG